MPRRIILPCLVLLTASLVGEPEDTMELMREYRGEAQGSGFGASVSGAGDVDADGFDDVVVGSPAEDKRAGRAVIYSGRNGEVLYELHGESAGDLFGWCVNNAGDVNNDGFGDVIVGAPGADDARGAAYVFSGEDGERLLKFEGDEPGDRLGHAASGTGDVNSNGFADLVVGAPFYDPKKKTADAGLVQVFDGKEGKPLHRMAGEAAGEHFGWSVAAAGDVNIDNFADFVAGAPLGSARKRAPATGVVRIYHGKKGKLLYTLAGDEAGDHFGHSVHGAGDVDGDGAGDIIVGTDTSPGYAVVFSGRKGIELHRFEGTGPSDRFGWSVGGGVDVDRDAYSDLVVGIPGDPDMLDDAERDRETRSRAQVYSGKTGELIFEIVSDAPEDHLGCSVSGAGNLDGDASGEIIVGADQLGVRAGYVRIYRLR